jgi:hypothetical protein
MAETNTTRLVLRQWGTGTDTPSRAEFNASFLSLENLAAIDKQDTFANRPAAGVRGTYFWDTTNTLLWRDTGAAWFNVGSKALDALFKGSTAASVPLTVDTFNASQSVNLLELKNNAIVVASVDKTGKYTGGAYAGTSAVLTNTVDATAVFVAKGSASQSANLLELKNNANVNQFAVSNTGTIQASYFRSGDANSTINAASSTTVANMTEFSGVPSLEVKALGSGSFTDFLYLKHDAIVAAAATRRLGILMKAGAEDATGAGRSGALYLKSTAANFDTPSLRIDVQNLNVWDFKPDNTTGSTTPYLVYTNGGYFRATPSGTGALRAGNTWLGAQGSSNDMYFRTGSSAGGFYFYSAGVHSDSSGNPGAGGEVMLSVLPDGFGQNVANIERLELTNVNDVDPGNPRTPFRIGPFDGQHIQMDSNEILGADDGDFGELSIQIGGGQLHLGTPETKVLINSKPIFVSTNGDDPPYALVTSDLWLDGRVGEGWKKWNGTTWQKINP